jgi:hypothetical protein
MIVEVKSKKYKNQTVLIDDEDGPRVKEYEWYLSPARGETAPFIYTRVWGGKHKTKQLKLQRFIMQDIPDQADIGHKDGNFLNNKKENLFIYKTYRKQMVLQRGKPILYKGEK